MNTVSKFYNEITITKKENPALSTDGKRTIHGYYDKGDAAILAKHYPNVGQDTIEEIADLINQPRLLEVTGIVELVERYLEGSFSQIREDLSIVSNPLSIMYWEPKKETVFRIKASESELLHGAMEKMALRRGSLDKINQMLKKKHGVVITYGCSCCGLAVAAKDLKALYASDYYRLREGYGRFFDSDVLTTTNALLSDVSVADVPKEILEASADFGEEEVQSYLRFAAAAEAALKGNTVTPNLTEKLTEVRAFLTGK